MCKHAHLGVAAAKRVSTTPTGQPATPTTDNLRHRSCDLNNSTDIDVVYARLRLLEFYLLNSLRPRPKDISPGAAAPLHTGY